MDTSWTGQCSAGELNYSKQFSEVSGVVKAHAIMCFCEEMLQYWAFIQCTSNGKTPTCTSNSKEICVFIDNFVVRNHRWAARYRGACLHVSTPAATGTGTAGLGDMKGKVGCKDNREREGKGDEVEAGDVLSMVPRAAPLEVEHTT